MLYLLFIRCSGHISCVLGSDDASPRGPPLRLPTLQLALVGPFGPFQRWSFSGVNACAERHVGSKHRSRACWGVERDKLSTCPSDRRPDRRPGSQVSGTVVPRRRRNLIPPWRRKDSRLGFRGAPLRPSWGGKEQQVTSCDDF